MKLCDLNRTAVLRLILGILLVLVNPCSSEDIPDAEVRVNRLSDLVVAVLEHYKTDDPMGLPGVNIPDPMPIPDIKNSLTFGTLTLKNQQVHGLSKFRIESVYSNVADMEMSIALSIDVLQVLGNYSLGTWFSMKRGASNITLTDFYGAGLAKLEVAREGHLEATDVNLDLTTMGISVYLENPGVMGSFLQGAMNSIGTLVFDAMKPFIMSELNTRILGDGNKHLRSFNQTFPNSLSPLDVGIAEGRKFVRKMGYDPYFVKDFTYTTGVIGLQLTHTWITGVASFHRVGNITVFMENNTVLLGLSVGTQELRGKCHWEVTMAGLMSTTGTVSFTIEYLEVEAKVNQSLDVRKKPNLEDLQITLGNFQLQFDGAGTVDYVIEVVVNILPNLLRHQIMQTIEEPLKIKVQQIFNDIDVENTILDKVKEFDDIEGNSAILGNSTVKPPHEEGLTVDESQLDDSIF